MSAKQGDVEVIREALRDSKGNIWSYKTYGGERALDRLAAALERAELGRDNALFELQGLEHVRVKDNGYLIARAEKAERALAEMREALRWLRMALGWAVFREDSRVWTSNEMRDIEAKIDAALRPEDTSDE